MLYARRLILPALLLLSCHTGRWEPWVQSMYPENGATDVPTNAQIRLFFATGMDTASVEAAFSILPATAGSFEWAGSAEVYFKPAQPLEPGTQYTYAVETTAVDQSGRYHLKPGRFTASFSTSDTTAPLVTVYMLGRSVMAGWFSYWGGSPYWWGRFTVEYHEVQSPPDIVASAQATIRRGRLRRRAREPRP